MKIAKQFDAHALRKITEEISHFAGKLVNVLFFCLQRETLVNTITHHTTAEYTYIKIERN